MRYRKCLRREVTIGGLIASITHKAAADFLSKLSTSNTHQDILSVYTQFFRPTLPSPKQATLKFRVASSSKASTTLHLEVFQDDKFCIGGFITSETLTRRNAVCYSSLTSTRLANLAVPGLLSMQTGWQLTPSPPPASLHDLEADAPSLWSGYLTPFDPLSYRKPHSYIRFFVPKGRTGRHFIDQWVTPGWKDNNSPNGPVWTNETIHFVVDNSFPILNDLLDTDGKFDTYNKTIKAGITQRQARLEGKDDRLWGEGLSDCELQFPWIISTLSSTTEVKRLLPKEGCKWLFMRNTVKAIVDGRMDLEIVLMNENGALVATSQHICQIVNVDRKRTREGNL